jgi:hypothetical protein
MPQLTKAPQSPQGWVLQYPGVDGVPFRGPSQTSLTQAEYENLDLVRDAKARIFILTDPNDLWLYNQIIDAAAKETVVITKQMVQWSDVKQTFVAFVHWEELFYELPNARFNRTPKPNDNQRYYS